MARVVLDGGRAADAATIRVLGIGDDDRPRSRSPRTSCATGALEIGVPIAVPTTYGVGRHAVAIEVTSDGAHERPVLVHVTIAIASVRRVAITPIPAIVRGRRRVAIDVDVENREGAAVDLTMSGSGTDLAVRFGTERIHLPPGGRARTRAKVRGPRHWSGEPVQHLVTLTARGRGDDTSVTARYIQRSLVPARVRTAVAALDRARAPRRRRHRGRRPTRRPGRRRDARRRRVDRPGQGGRARRRLRSRPGWHDPGWRVRRDGERDGGRPSVGRLRLAGHRRRWQRRRWHRRRPRRCGVGVRSARVTETALFGTITLADGADAAGVNVTADPISLETPPDPAATLAAPAGSSRPAKIWSARFGAAQPNDGVGVQRATLAVDPYVDESAEGGAWLIDAVALRRNYEVVFAKDGYTTQSFVVSPPDSGDRVELDVELVPGAGSISGRVVDGSGRPLGGVALTATDGTVTISTTSSSVASVTAGIGDFSLESLSVPSVYTVVAQLDGSGTEVARFELAVGTSSVTGQTIEMRDGVGSISGRVFRDGALLGGASVVATIGDDVYRTTTLTGGLAGTYYLPRVPIPATGTYTITASGPGATPQSQARAVDGNETGVDFRLTSSTGGIRGTVVSDTLGPLPGAFVTITRDDIDFTTTTSGSDAALSSTRAPGAVADGTSLYLRTAAAPTPGSFEIGDLPPGEYVLTVEDYRHETFARSITLVAGSARTVPAGGGPIVLETLPPTGVAFGTLTIAAIDEATRAPLPNAQYTVEGAGTPRQSLPATPDPTKDPPDYFQAFRLAVGTYTLTVTKAGYRDERLTMSVGAGGATRTVAMRAKGPLTVRVVDRSSGPDEIALGGFTLQAMSLSNPALPPLVGGIIIDTAGGTYWETASGVDVANGVWLLQVTGHPAGFHIPPQPLTPSGAPMQFEITRDSPSRVEFVLVAQPYPSIDVTVSRPTGAGLTTAPLDQPASTVVALECPSSSRPPTALAQVVIGGSRDPGAYNIDPLEVQAAVGSTGELADCFLTASSDGYATRRIDFAPALALGAPTERHDRRVHTILLPPARTVTGTLYWLPDPTDPASRIDLRDSPISATNVITGYAESQTDDGTSPSAPRPLQSDVAARWSPDGTFTLDQQVFGMSAYTIVPQQITPGVVQITVPPSPNLVTASSGVTIAEVPDADPNDQSQRYDMRLTDPAPGQISGCVRLVSLDPDPPTIVPIEASSPGSTSADGVITRPAAPTVRAAAELRRCRTRRWHRHRSFDRHVLDRRRGRRRLAVHVRDATEPRAVEHPRQPAGAATAARRDGHRPRCDLRRAGGGHGDGARRRRLRTTGRARGPRDREPHGRDARRAARRSGDGAEPAHHRRAGRPRRGGSDRLPRRVPARDHGARLRHRGGGDRSHHRRRADPPDGRQQHRARRRRRIGGGRRRGAAALRLAQWQRDRRAVRRPRRHRSGRACRGSHPGPCVEHDPGAAGARREWCERHPRRLDRGNDRSGLVRLHALWRTRLLRGRARPSPVRHRSRATERPGRADRPDRGPLPHREQRRQRADTGVRDDTEVGEPLARGARRRRRQRCPRRGDPPVPARHHAVPRTGGTRPDRAQPDRRLPDGRGVPCHGGRARRSHRGCARDERHRCGRPAGARRARAGRLLAGAPAGRHTAGRVDGRPLLSGHRRDHRPAGGRRRRTAADRPRRDAADVGDDQRIHPGAQRARQHRR